MSPPSCARKRFTPAQFYARWLVFHGFWEASAPQSCVLRYEDLASGGAAARVAMTDCFDVDVTAWDRVASTYIRDAPPRRCALAAPDLRDFAELHERFRHITEGRYGYRLAWNATQSCGLRRDESVYPSEGLKWGAT